MRSVLILVAVALATSAGAAPRAGKVVRIERKPPGYTGHPRYCSVQPGEHGLCVGTKAPEIGDRLTAIDHRRVLGVLRVSKVDAYNDGCQQTHQWMIQTILDSGDVSSARGTTVLGLSDVPLDTRTAKLVTVDKTPTGHTWGVDTIYAIDNNADGTVDLEFIQYACDDFGNATQTAVTSHCHEVWAQQAPRGLERLRHDRIRVCN